jgi:hypothetical protein
MSCKATTTFSSGVTLMVTKGCGFCAKHVFTLVIGRLLKKPVVRTADFGIRIMKTFGPSTDRAYATSSVRKSRKLDMDAYRP